MTTTPAELNVDDLRRRARRRLVGAIVLALAAAVFVPMLLESEPKPLGEDVAVRIPPVDDGKFVNKLPDKPATEVKGTGGRIDAPRADAVKADGARAEAILNNTPDAARGEPKADAKDIAAAKDNAAAPAAAADAPKESPADAAKDVAAPHRTLAEAEQKMLGAPAKPPAAAPAAPAKAADKSPPAVPAKAPDKAPPATPAKAVVAPAPAPSAAVTPAPSAAVTPAPSATTALAPSAAVAPATAPAAVPTAEAVAAGFSVQLAAFADDKGANSLANKLKKAGYAAYTEPLTTSKGTLWRVRVGPYPSREAAAAGRDKLKGEGYSGIVAPSK